MSTSGSEDVDITFGDVLEELKCPVCMEQMTPPIPMCQNGHNICNRCRQKVNQCPTCRQEFSQSRCWLLENVIQKMKFRCQYYTEGCEFMSTSQFIKPHEAKCPYRPFNCPLSVVVAKNCCWRGHISRMWDHISYKHGCLSPSEEGEFLFTVHCAISDLLYNIFYVLDETFFLVYRMINKDLYCCVLYVGPEEWASRYTYSMTIKKIDGSDHATMCLPTPSYCVDVETLFKKRECAVFSYAFWDRCRCVYSNGVSCEVKIRSLLMPAFKIPK